MRLKVQNVSNTKINQVHGHNSSIPRIGHKVTKVLVKKYKSKNLHVLKEVSIMPEYLR